VKGVNMLEDCILVYRMGDDEQLKYFCEEMAKIIMRRDNIDNHFEIVIDCLMKLPHTYLDKSIVGYGAAHSEKSEFCVRAKYIKCNEGLDEELKLKIIKACDLKNLNSEEMKELENLDILDDEEMWNLYRFSLKREEQENRILGEKGKIESMIIQQMRPMSGEKMKEEALKKGEELLKRQPDLRTKNYFRWSEKGTGQNVEMLCELLRGNAIPTTSLYLSGNNDIGDEGATKVSESLMTNTTLTELYLRSNKIGVEGAAKISESLMINTTLTTLNLNYNSVGDEGAAKISESLMKNTTLTELNLYGNSIGAKGAAKISELLKINTTLTSLNLSCNHIYSDGVKNTIREAWKERSPNLWL